MQNYKDLALNELRLIPGNTIDFMDTKEIDFLLQTHVLLDEFELAINKIDLTLLIPSLSQPYWDYFLITHMKYDKEYGIYTRYPIGWSDKLTTYEKKYRIDKTNPLDFWYPCSFLALLSEFSHIPGFYFHSLGQYITLISCLILSEYKLAEQVLQDKNRSYEVLSKLVEANKKFLLQKRGLLLFYLFKGIGIKTSFVKEDKDILIETKACKIVTDPVPGVSNILGVDYSFGNLLTIVRDAKTRIGSADSA